MKRILAVTLCALLLAASGLFAAPDGMLLNKVDDVVVNSFHTAQEHAAIFNPCWAKQ